MFIILIEKKLKLIAIKETGYVVKSARKNENKFIAIVIDLIAQEFKN